MLAPVQPIQDAVSLVNAYPKVPLTVDCVIFGFEANKLKVLLIQSDLAIYKNQYSLLGDFVRDNEELDDAAYRILKQRTGMNNVFLDQVKAFSNPTRHPGGRVITIAYCSLLNIQHHALNIHDNQLDWFDYAAVSEMAFDHKEITDACHAWLQKRIQEHPLGFNLLPVKFSLRELQNLYEAILGLRLDRRNFRKKFASMNLLIDTKEMEQDVSHRPGKLYQFNFEKYENNKRKWTGIDF
ncbi:MAG: NUDIX hydrolase [Sphingobacteriia bacterium]|nr:MAG: NUDIX hydrolase [Sphingobacteriia bacterium]TAG29497.1 MAG: NUDIX hydrolase [Sphingobacteriia bacterium]TAH08073.1 MAG: NUDIX hydrolase [Sphingobacteriia bacterium]